MAHEIKNPAAFVNSNLGTLQRYRHNLLQIIDAYEHAEPQIPRDTEAYQTICTLKKEIDLGFLRQDALAVITGSADGIRRVRQIVQDLKEFSHVDRAEWQDFDVHKGLDSTLNIVRNEIRHKAQVARVRQRAPGSMSALADQSGIHGPVGQCRARWPTRAP